MTKEEYIRRMNESDDWAPGWEAIDNEFERLYPDVKPAHFATDITARAMFGGNEYLDGYSVYDTGKDYKHMVTYGMSCLYAGEEFFGKKFSGWGYEMTIRLKEEKAEDCLWAAEMLGNLARYTYQSKSFFGFGQVIAGNGSSLHIGTDSAITALITVKDPTAQTLDTPHGEVAFIQLVGITESELNAIRQDIGNIKVLTELMRKDNPEFVTDMNRTHSYL
ncbi:MAG: suppressor of fused domain protein [Oscillospiraceae bacterium]|nr:suppressor of fused domain protein [Oscillospiraceae bacterium]